MSLQPTSRSTRLAALAIVSASLFGCFGDGDGPERIPGTPQPKVIGQLIDAPISGVTYLASGGDGGTTNSSGQFEYIEGENVTFSIGGIVLGTAPGAPIVTPVELTRSSDPNDTPAVNQLVFLQSLDTDGDPSNGITISTDVASRADGQDSLDFSSGDFRQTAENLLRVIAPSASLISNDEALSNFYITYAEMGGFDTFGFAFAGFPPVGGDSGFTLIFSDEFNTDGAPDAGKWNLETGYGPNNSGWGNNEWQLYTTASDNVRVEDGNLVIQARCDTPPCGVRDGTVTSARLNTKDKFEFKFGKVIARIKPPVGAGSWPAFWSLGANFPETPWPRAGEIDFMEMFPSVSDDRTTHFTMHWCDQTIQAPDECSFPEGRVLFSDSLQTASSLGDDFHIFEADWNGAQITAKLDGVEFFTRNIDAGTMEEFLREFFLILNVAMGGTLGSDNQPPSGDEVWPQTMLVDYIRVFQRTGSGVVEDTEIDFEDAPESYNFGTDGGFGGGAVQVLANPVSEGINTSAQVARMLKFAGEPFGGSLLALPAPLEIAGGTFTMKVWSPRPVNVLLKLEGGTTEPELNIPHGGSGWEELSFNFDNFTGSFTGLTFIFDLGIVGDATNDPDNWTFYFDDIVVPTGNGGGTDPDPTEPEAFFSDFEAAPETYDFGMDGGFGGGAAQILANPVPGGINTSAQVGRMLKFAGETFAGSLWTLPSPIDVVPGTSFTMKVWSSRPVPVTFKLEGATDAEVVANHSGNGWEELTFEFPTYEGTVTGITLIFDNGVVGDATNDPDNWTFYFDDIEQIPPQPDEPPGLSQIDLPITFDDDTVDYTLIDFGGAQTTLVADPEDAANTVASSLRPDTAETFAGTTMSTNAGLASAIPFSATETTIGIRVYSPAAGIPVRMKAENIDNADISVEAEVMTSVANEWETLVFDFTDVVTGPMLDLTQSYSKLNVFFNFNAPGATAGTQTFLWDDVEFGVLAPVVDETPPTLTSVSIASDNANPLLAALDDTLTLTFTASEPIATPVVTIGGVAANVTGAATTWQATRSVGSADADGLVDFSIEFADLADNAGTNVTATSDSSSVTIDTLPPTATLSGAPVNFTSLDPIALTLTFSEPVTGITLASFTVTNGAVSALVAVDAATYTFNVTPNGTGDLVVALPSAAGVDAAGNFSTEDAVTIANNLDADAPLLTSVFIASSNANPALARTGDVITLTMAANEDILAPTVVIAGTAADLVTGSGTIWTATRTLLATDTEGPINFLITFEDIGGNPGQAASVTTDGSTVTFDITAPDVQITGIPTTIQTLDPFGISITFDEDVTGFEAADLAVTNATATDFTLVDAANYTAIVTPDGNGTVAISIAANVATDGAGNGNTQATVSADLDLQPLWTLVWSDEFDGSALDTTNWTARTDADCPAPCDGVQSYTTGNIIVAAGAMTIEGREEAGSTYSSGLIDTRGKLEFLHGRIEIDARMPGTLGTLPSLFLLPVDDSYGPWPQSGEIDLVNAPDLGPGNGTLEHTLQYGLPVPENTTTTVTSEPTNPANSNTLTYALEWEAGEIRWFVDDVHVATQTQDNWYAYGEDADGVYTLGADAAPFDQNFYLAIGLGIADTAGVGSTFPQSLQVDAVRVYECANAVDPAAGTGCSTGDAGIMPVSAPSEPYTESLQVYTDGLATLDFVDAADPGTPVAQALVAAENVGGGATVNSNNLGAVDGADVVWSLDINAAAGSAGVRVGAADNGPTTGFFDLGGSETAGEILFRMKVTSATAGTDISVGLDGAGGAAGRDALTFAADDQWQQYSVKIADVLTASVGSGTTLDLTNLVTLFALDVTGGSAVLSLDDIQVVAACRDTGGCEATPRIPDVVVTTIYPLQDFESIDASGAVIGDGWRYFINVFEGATYLFGYPGDAPNGPQISAIAAGEGGPEQGLQQFSVYSDYECCPGGGTGGGPSGHQSANGLVETNVFIEARSPANSISADDVGDTWTMTFDAKRGNLAGASRAYAFIKVLNPLAGFSTTANEQIEMTTAPIDWQGYTIELTIGDWEGQVLQFGFQTTASDFEPSAVFYDNIEVTSVDGP